MISIDLDYAVKKMLLFWAQLGADGVFVDGLEAYAKDVYLANALDTWKTSFKQYGTQNVDHAFMTSRTMADLAEAEAVRFFGLVEAEVDPEDNFTVLAARVSEAAVWSVGEDRPWINWIAEGNGVNVTNAVLAVQMLMPGSISLEDEHLKEGNQSLVIHYAFHVKADEAGSVIEMLNINMMYNFNPLAGTSSG